MAKKTSVEADFSEIEKRLLTWSTDQQTREFALTTQTFQELYTKAMALPDHLVKPKKRGVERG